MRSNHTTRSIDLADPLTLLDQSAAGLVLSGDSGTGKSNLMRLLFRHVTRLGIGATLIDPHGDLAADIERDCAALPPSQRPRVVVLKFAGAPRLPAINPLALDAVPADEFTSRAQIASKVGHVAKILLYSWGERDFNSKPVLCKWVTRCLTMLARARLTIPDVRHFFDTQSRVYAALTRTAGDFVTKLELEELADMRPRDREDLIASTKNRFLGFLENPIVETVLGSTQPPLFFRRLIQERAIVLVDLNRGGVLRDEDAEIFANLVLSEILYAAFNTPRERRVPHFLFLDELPVFASSFELLTRAGQIRKFLIRFVCAFQGTQLFPERTEDRLLNALIGQCNVQFLFRHKNPVDAKFFAELLHLPAADPWKVKHALTQLQQYQDGHELVTLTDESSSWSTADQRGESEGQETSSTTGSSSTRNEGNSETVTESERLLSSAVQRARGEQSGTSRGQISSTGRSESRTTSQSSTETTGGSRTRKQTLVPRVRDRTIVASVQFLSLDEDKALQGRTIATLPVGAAIAYVAGRGASRITFPLAKDCLRRTPRFAAKKLRQLRALYFSRPEFATHEERAADRRAFERRLVEYLDGLADGRPGLPPAPPADPNPLLDI